MNKTQQIEGGARLFGRDLHSEVEFIQGRAVRGWVYDPADSARRLTVEIVSADDGAVLGEMVADDLREDLLAADLGDGRYGFEAKADFAPGFSGEIEIEVREKSSGASIGQGFLSNDPVHVVRRLHGYVDLIYKRTVRGWACDPADPARRLTVEIVSVADGAVLAQVVADRLRDDLIAAGVGDGGGCYGFEAEVAARFDSEIEIDVRVTSTGESIGHGFLSDDPSEFAARATLEADGSDAIDPQMIFDADWYNTQNPDVRSAGVDAFTHYWSTGAYEGRNPHPLFDSAYYAVQCEEGAQGVGNALMHFVEKGAARGLSPHSLFDREYYRAGNPDVVASGMNEFYHFALVGDREGRASHPLFDPIYYLRNNPDVANQNKGPLRHFLETGGLERRNPHPMFDSQYYLWLHPDVAARGINPLVHYTTQPRKTRRHPHPLFDGAVQMLTSAFAQETSIDPLADYIQFRSNLDQNLVRRHATYIPAPSRALLARRDATTQRGEIDEPLVSVLVPAYNSGKDYFSAAINSVRAQTYRNWEIVIVNDGSPDPHVEPMIDAIAETDKRIRAVHLSKNRGISGATNEALRQSKGEFVALMDHDDVLEADALEVMIRALLATGADAAYSDQAYLSAWNTFERTFYKPDWSPAMLAGVMYVGHLLIVRRSIADAIDGFDPKFDRLQDYEFMLRVSEITNKVIHIPRILYHWRMIPGSIAHDSGAKGAIEPIQCAAVDAYFERIGFPAITQPLKLPHRIGVIPKQRKIYPEIDVIIRADRPAAVVAKMRSRLEAAPVPWARVLTVGGQEAKVSQSSVASLFAEIREALEASNSPFALFLDPSINIVDPRWLDHLLLYAERDDVAFVAPHVYRRSGIVAAAGFVVSTAALAPAMQGARFGEDGYAGSLSCTREVSALPAAMMMIKRKATRGLGLDADFITPLYGFGDAAIRAVAAGYRNIALAPRLIEVDDDYAVVDPEAIIDAILFRDLHARTIAKGDPFYNVNFPSDSADFVA